MLYGIGKMDEGKMDEEYNERCGCFKLITHLFSS